MTLEELKNCSGFTVQVSLNGEDAFADIDTQYSPTGEPMLVCPSPEGASWSKVLSLPISEEIAAKMSHNGDRNLFSKIHIIRESEDLATYRDM